MEQKENKCCNGDAGGSRRNEEYVDSDVFVNIQDDVGDDELPFN